jgi:hypothetical protein
MFKYGYVLLLLMLLSCTNEIELEQPNYQSKIVVDGSIESNGFANVYLMRSSPFLTEYDSASVRATFINAAKITLTCSNGDSEILTLFRQNSFFPPFVYKSIRMKGIAGESYSLEVLYNGETVTATTTIPQPPTMTIFEMESQSDSSGLLKIGMLKEASVTCYAFIQYRSIKADQNFHPAGVPVYKLDGMTSVSNMYVLRCDENNLYLSNPKKQTYSNWPKTLFSVQDTVLVKFGLVDVASYQVLKSLFADESVRNNPFAFSSAGIQSNIVGGIGRWTGIGMAPTRIYP